MAKRQVKKNVPQKKAEKVPAKRGRPAKENKRVELKALARKIEFKDPRSLRTDPNNSRVHSLDQIEAIAKSIDRFGFTKPVLVDAVDMIIAGHGAVAAALSRKLEFVPVIVLDHLTEQERRAYVIADNKLAENSDWDVAVLKRELAALDQDDFDLDVLGFDESELEDLLPDLEAEADEILARDDKKRAEQAAAADEGSEAEETDDDEQHERETRGEAPSGGSAETTEIEVERPPDMIVKQPVPERLAAIVGRIDFKALDREVRERKEAAEDNFGSPEHQFWNRLHGAIQFAMMHFDFKPTEGSEDVLALETDERDM